MPSQTGLNTGNHPIDFAYILDEHEIISFLTSQHTYARAAQDEEIMTRRDPHGRLFLHKTPFHELTLGAIKLLVSGNRDALQVADNYGALPLHMACKSGTVAVGIVKYLVESDRNSLNVRDSSGNSPLHYACLGANFGVVEYLLNVPADCTEVNDEGKLPLHLLCEATKPDVSNEADDENECSESIGAIFRLLRAHPGALLDS